MVGLVSHVKFELDAYIKRLRLIKVAGINRRKSDLRALFEYVYHAGVALWLYFWGFSAVEDVMVYGVDRLRAITFSVIVLLVSSALGDVITKRTRSEPQYLFSLCSRVLLFGCVLCGGALYQFGLQNGFFVEDTFTGRTLFVLSFFVPILATARFYWIEEDLYLYVDLFRSLFPFRKGV